MNIKREKFLYGFLLIIIIIISVIPCSLAIGEDPFSATYGDTLSDVVLPEGYVWAVEDPASVSVGNVGKNIFKAKHSDESLERDFVIDVKPTRLKDIEVSTQGRYYYTGKPIEPTVVCKFNNKVLIKGQDYSVIYEDNTKVGTAKVIIEGINNFCGKSTVCFSIIKTDVESVNVSENEIELAPGAYYELTATVLPAYATIQDIVWTSSDESIATVDENGKVFAVSNGEVIITATSVDSGESDYCVLNVVTHVQQLTITVGSVNLFSGQTYIFKALVFPWNSNDKSVFWSSSDEKIATINEDGVLNALTDGTVTITAVSNDGNFSDSCLVSITTPDSYVRLRENRIYLRSQNNYPLRCDAFVWNSEQKIIWSSSNEKVAKVDENGVVHPIKVGKATITASSVDGEFSDSCTVYVYYTWWQLIIWVLFGCLWYFK